MIEVEWLFYPARLALPAETPTFMFSLSIISVFFADGGNFGFTHDNVPYTIPAGSQPDCDIPRSNAPPFHAPFCPSSPFCESRESSFFKARNGWSGIGHPLSACRCVPFRYEGSVRQRHWHGRSVFKRRHGNAGMIQFFLDVRRDDRQRFTEQFSHTDISLSHGFPKVGKTQKVPHPLTTGYPTCRRTHLQDWNHRKVYQMERMCNGNGWV